MKQICLPNSTQCAFLSFSFFCTLVGQGTKSGTSFFFPFSQYVMNIFQRGVGGIFCRCRSRNLQVCSSQGPGASLNECSLAFLVVEIADLRSNHYTCALCELLLTFSLFLLCFFCCGGWDGLFMRMDGWLGLMFLHTGCIDVTEWLVCWEWMGEHTYVVKGSTLL